jgi:putative transcriptional regulator
MNRPSLGNQLVKFRERRSLTQLQLSIHTGIKRPALSHYEKDRREPDLQTLIIFAEFFKVSLDELVGRTEGDAS